MASWGHIVFKSTPPEILKARGDHWESVCHIRTSWLARQKTQCLKPTGYLARYTYTTGKNGGVTTSDRWLCEKHARQFAARYGVEMLEKEPSPELDGRGLDADMLRRGYQ